MGAYLARRLVALLPTMLLASLIVFVTIRLIPGDVIDLNSGQRCFRGAAMSYEIRL